MRCYCCCFYNINIICDCLGISGGWTPTVHLFTQSGGKLKFREEDNVFIPYKAQSNQISIGSSNGNFELDDLINNAINYSEDGKEVEIRFYDIEDNLLIEVSDQGLGIEEKHLARLFERFYRVDKSRARNKGGTGLGLAIVKHIVEAHNQTISVRSSIGKGSTFSFTLKKIK